MTEPWTARDTLLFSVTGLTILLLMFAFMFSLSNMYKQNGSVERTPLSRFATAVIQTRAVL